MKLDLATEGLETAADTVDTAAQRLRGVASEIVPHGNSEGDARSARIAAGTLASVSSSLETVAESARASGLAIRDRGRDAARALDRGERVLREDGLTGAAVHVGYHARRHAGKLAAAAGASLLALWALSRRSRDA